MHRYITEKRGRSIATLLLGTSMICVGTLALEFVKARADVLDVVLPAEGPVVVLLLMVICLTTAVSGRLLGLPFVWNGIVAPTAVFCFALVTKARLGWLVSSWIALEESTQIVRGGTIISPYVLTLVASLLAGCIGAVAATQSQAGGSRTRAKLGATVVCGLILGSGVMLLSYDQMLRVAKMNNEWAGRLQAALCSGRRVTTKGKTNPTSTDSNRERVDSTPHAIERKPLTGGM